VRPHSLDQRLNHAPLDIGQNWHGGCPIIVSMTT
jgi:hypothetical protein